METVLIDAQTGTVTARFDMRYARKRDNVLVDPAGNWRGTTILSSPAVYEIKYDRNPNGKPDWQSVHVANASVLLTEQKSLHRRGYHRQRVVCHNRQGETFTCIV